MPFQPLRQLKIYSQLILKKLYMNKVLYYLFKIDMFDIRYIKNLLTLNC